MNFGKEKEFDFVQTLQGRQNRAFHNQSLVKMHVNCIYSIVYYSNVDPNGYENIAYYLIFRILLTGRSHKASAGWN